MKQKIMEMQGGIIKTTITARLLRGEEKNHKL